MSATSSTRDVRVHPAGAAEADRALALVDALIQEDSGRHDPDANQRWAADHGAEHVARVIADPRKIALLAETGGQVIGGLMGGLLEPTPFEPSLVARLGSLYVVPTHRGGGAGTALVSVFLAWAADQGASHAQVAAYAANTAAVRFYERQGLEPLELVLRRRLTPRR